MARIISRLQATAATLKSMPSSVLEATSKETKSEILTGILTGAHTQIASGAISDVTWDFSWDFNWDFSSGMPNEDQILPGPGGVAQAQK